MGGSAGSVAMASGRASGSASASPSSTIPARRIAESPSSPADPYALLDADSDEREGLLAGAPGDAAWVGHDDFEGLSWWKRPSVYWLVGPFFLYTLAFGGSIVPKLNLIVDLICEKHFSDRMQLDPDFTFVPVVVGGDNPQCKTGEVQKLVSTFMLVLNVVVGGLSAITAPKLGALSDRYGRKRLIVISSSGGIVSEIITILAARFPSSVPYQALIVGCVFEGLSGSFTAGTVLSHSYTSDCTSPSKRGVAIGYLHACIFTGLALGPLMAAYFVELTGTLVSIFYVTLACHLFFIFFILLATPESLSAKKQLLAREKHAREQEALDSAGGWRALAGSNPLAPLSILMPPGRSNAPVRRNLLALAFCDYVILGSAMTTATIVLLYSELMFEWGNLQTSQFMSLISSVRVFVLMAVFPVVTWYFRGKPLKEARKKALTAQKRRDTGDNSGTSIGTGNQDEDEHAHVLRPETNAGADMLDIWLIRTAIMSDMLGAVGYLLARTPELFYLAGTVTAFGGIGSATIQASVTKHVPAHKVGELLGAMGLLHALARIVTPVLFNGLYSSTVETFPQAVFVLLIGLFMLALGASWLLRSGVFIPDSDEVGRAEESPLLSPARQTADTLAEEQILPA